MKYLLHERKGVWLYIICNNTVCILLYHASHIVWCVLYRGFLYNSHCSYMILAYLLIGDCIESKYIYMYNVHLYKRLNDSWVLDEG